VYKQHHLSVCEEVQKCAAELCLIVTANAGVMTGVSAFTAAQRQATCRHSALPDRTCSIASLCYNTFLNFVEPCHYLHFCLLMQAEALGEASLVSGAVCSISSGQSV